MAYIIYRNYARLINIFNSYIFNSFLKHGLFLRVFIFIQLSLRILFKLKTKFFLRLQTFVWSHILPHFLTYFSKCKAQQTY